jgi:DNA-binding NarL/FixJ family response regulator
MLSKPKVHVSDELCPWCHQKIELWYSEAGVAEVREETMVFYEPLTARERDIMRYLRTTLTVHEIAAALSVSINTIKTHQQNIYRKLGVHGRREAVRNYAS